MGATYVRKERIYLRQINIILDLYSGAVCLILFCHLCFGRGKKDQMRQRFIGMCAFGFGMAMGDIPNWAFEGFHKPWYPAALWCGTLIFWLCSPLILLAFTGYLTQYMAPKVTVHKFFKRLAVALCVLHMAGTLLSVRNGMFFTITPENIYRRGEWFWLSQALPFSMYAVDIAIFAAYRKSLSRREFHILSSYIVLPLIAEAVQMFHYGVALLNAGISLGLLVIFINIQSEQELRIERQEKELLESRMDIMLSQIQPHFLYNTLTAIRCLCDRDPRQAKQAIRDFSMFLRANMDSLGSKAPVPFNQELSHTEHYLALERQRFQERLRVVYEIGPLDFYIPPLTLQPMVENAVRHGILKRERGGTVTIGSLETDSAYIVTVRDDGVGFQLCQKSPGHGHIGIENVRYRLNALCGGTLDIQSAADAGTIITITIPKEETANELSRRRR